MQLSIVTNPPALAKLIILVKFDFECYLLIKILCNKNFSLLIKVCFIKHLKDYETQFGHNWA